MLSRQVLYYGKDEPLPQQTRLRAGPLTLVYEAGDLRYIKLGEREILRRIYVAIRDRNWGTIAPVLSHMQMDVGEDGFRIAYDVENREREIDFRWHGTIAGAADGTITFTMAGQAYSTFWRNRIGFCVLHPAAAAGAAATVERVDGTSEAGSLPRFIEKAQPVLPFFDMQAMRHEVEPGIWAEVRFAGDLFEMEDQRNWTDASYKTFCTPLRLPFPVEIQAGTRVEQSITLKLVGDRLPDAGSNAQPREGGARAADAVRVTLDHSTPGMRLPDLGLGMAGHELPLSERAKSRLATLHLGHLRVDLHLGTEDYAPRLRRAAAEAAALRVPLEMAVFVTGNAAAELAGLNACLAALGGNPQIARWLVYPERELFGGGSPTAAAVEATRQGLAAHLAHAPLGSGTNSDFILLQRSLPPMELLDLVTLAVNPQVHAFDNASMVETLEAQAMVVASAQRLAGPRPVIVSPVTLKPRFNPVATGPIPPTPPGELPPQVDPRQMSLFGAAWTLGSIKHLARAGVASITYYETTGWRGVMETENGSPVPDKFPSLPGSVFPLYHVLADVGEFRGGEVLSARSSDGLAVEALGLQQPGRSRIVLANLTADVQHVLVNQGLPAEIGVWRMDETNALEAIQNPEAFRNRPGERLPTPDGSLSLEMRPYAVVRVDL